MAFALTSFYAGGVKEMTANPVQAYQRYIFTVTGLAADVALDIGNFSGTFWTAALANTTLVNATTTLGQMAGDVRSFLDNHKGALAHTIGIYVPQIFGRAFAAAASGVIYTRSIDATTKLPIFTFAAANGELAYTVMVDYALVPGQKVEQYTSNITV